MTTTAELYLRLLLLEQTSSEVNDKLRSAERQLRLSQYMSVGTFAVAMVLCCYMAELHEARKLVLVTQPDKEETATKPEIVEIDTSLDAPDLSETLSGDSVATGITSQPESLRQDEGGTQSTRVDPILAKQGIASDSPVVGSSVGEVETVVVSHKSCGPNYPKPMLFHSVQQRLEHEPRPKGDQTDETSHGAPTKAPELNQAPSSYTLCVAALFVVDTQEANA